MSEVTSPVILDSTGLEIVEALKALRRRQIQVVSLDETPLTAHAAVMEAEGVPQYVEDVSLFSAYGLTETGWYIFARIYAGGKIKVDASTTVSGAAGYIATPGEDHVDVAVRFEVAAMGRKVTVSWGGFADAIVFRATDLAIRNLDYMVTNYTYDLAPYAVWEYQLASGTFSATKAYFTKDEQDQYVAAAVTENDPVPAQYYVSDGEGGYRLVEGGYFAGGVTYYTKSGTDYSEASVTPDDPVPTVYYEHSKLTLRGMVKNVTYELNEKVDCGIEIELPEIPDDGHGAWFEFHLMHAVSGSITLKPPEGVKGGTAGASASITAGLNVVDLHYTHAAGLKLWSLANVHTNIPA